MGLTQKNKYLNLNLLISTIISFNRLLIVFLLIILLGLGGYAYWHLKGSDFIQAAIESKIELINIPADSIGVSYEEGTMDIYQPDLVSYLNLAEKDHIVINVKNIHANGIQWMKVNSSKKLHADTLEIFVKSFSYDMKMLSEIELPSNDLLEHISSDVVLIHVEELELKEIDELDNVSAKNGLVNISDFTYDVQTKELTYEKPTLTLEAIKTSIADIEIVSDKLVVDEGLISLNIGKVTHDKDLVGVDFAEILIKGNVLEFDKQISLSSIKVKAKKMFLDFEKEDFTFKMNRNVKVGEIKLEVDELEAKRFSKIIGSAKNVKLEINGNSYSNNKFSFTNHEISAQSFAYYDLKDFSLNGGKVKLSKDKVIINDYIIKSRLTPQAILQINSPTKSLYNLSGKEVVLNGIDFDYFVDVEELIVESVRAEKASLVIYTDNNSPTADRPKKVISQIIKDIKFPFYFKQVDVVDSELDFELKAIRREDTGHIYIKAVNGKINELSNIQSRLEKKEWMKTKFSGLLMGNAPLTLSLDYNMLDKQNSYQYKGEVKGVNFEDVNRMLEDLTAVRAKKGHFDELLVDVKANKYRSDGTLEFYYRGLKLKHVEERINGIRDPLRLFVNKMVVRQNNIRGRSPKVATISLRHPENHSNFRCIWEAVYSGIEKSLFPKIPKIPKPLKRFRN